MERHLVITGLLFLGLVFLAPLAAGIHNADPTATLEGYQAQVDPAVVGPETVGQGFEISVSWDEGSTLGAEMRITDVFIYPPGDFDLSENNGDFGAASDWEAESSSDRVRFYRSTGSGAEKLDTNPPEWTFQVPVQAPNPPPSNDGESLTWRADPCHSPIRGSGIFVCGSGVHLGNEGPSRDAAPLEAESTWDNSIPVVSIETPLENEKVGGGVSIEWTTSDDNPGEASVDYRAVDTNGWSSATDCKGVAEDDEGNGACTWDSPDDLPDVEGSYEVRVRSTDKAENTGAAISDEFAVDNKDPQVTVDVPTAGEILNEQVNVEWSVTDGHAYTVDVSYDEVDGQSANWRSATDCQGVEGLSCTWDSDEDLRAESDVKLKVQATDAAGNAGEAISDRFALDNVDPVASGVIVDVDGDDNHDGSVSGAVEVSWTTSDQNPDTVELEYRKGDGPWEEIETGVTDDGSYTWETDTDAIEDGNYEIGVTPNDELGNTGARAQSDTFTIDNTPPTVENVALPADEALTGTFDVTWTTNDEHPDTFELLYRNLSALPDDVDDGVGWDVGPEGPLDDDGEQEHSWDTSTLVPDAEGTYQVRINASDEVDNFGLGTSQTFLLDNRKPVPAITAPTDGTILNDTVTVNWTVNEAHEKNATLGYYADPADGEAAAWSTLYEGAYVNNSTWDTTTVPDGRYALQVNTSDVVEHNGTDVVQVTVDNDAPSISFVEPEAGEGENVPTVGAKDFNVSVEIHDTTDVNGSVYCAIADRDAVECDQQPADDGDWNASRVNHTFHHVPEGTHEVVVNATDRMAEASVEGRHTEASLDIEVDYDTEVASLSIKSADKNQTVSSFTTNIDEKAGLDLHAHAFDAAGNWLGNVTATWSIEGFENKDPPAGEAAVFQFVGDEVGEGQITVDHEDVDESPAATTGTITVEKGVLDHIELAPSEETLQVDETVSITATGEDQNDNPVDLGEPDWSATCGSLQSAADTGDASTHEVEFTAPESPGECEVTVKQTDDGDAIDATATITVTSGTPDAVVLSCPERATAGTEAICQAHAADEHGNELPDVGIEWTAHDDRDQQLSVEDGVLTMPTSTADGPVTVEAANASASISTTSTLIIQPGPLDHVTIQDATTGSTVGDATLEPGDTLELAAAGHDAHGNPLGTLEEISWSIDGDEAAFSLSAASGATSTLEALDPGTATVQAEHADGDVDTAATGTLTVQDEQPEDQDEDQATASLEIAGLSSPSHPEGQWVDDREVQLAWDPPTGEAADDVAAYAYALVDEGAEEPVASTVDASVTEVTASAPADGRYEVHVQAQTQDGQAGPVATYGPVLVDTEAPTAASDVSVQAAGDAVELSWAHASDEASGVAGYHVYRAAGQAIEDATRLTSTPVEAASFTDDGDLEFGETYRYAVEAVDRAGLEGPLSDPVQVQVEEALDENAVDGGEPGEQAALQASPETAATLAAHLDAGADLELVALDTTGDGRVDALDENLTEVLVDRGSSIENETALLLQMPDQPPSAVWVPAGDTAYPLHLVEATGEANVTETDGRIEAAFGVEEPRTWSLIDLPDERPDAELVGVETSQGPVPADRVWREDGSVLVLDDSDTTYRVVYETSDGVPGPSVGLVVAVLAGLALAVKRRPRRAGQE